MWFSSKHNIHFVRLTCVRVFRPVCLSVLVCLSVWLVSVSVGLPVCLSVSVCPSDFCPCLSVRVTCVRVCRSVPPAIRGPRARRQGRINTSPVCVKLPTLSLALLPGWRLGESSLLALLTLLTDITDTTDTADNTGCLRLLTIQRILTLVPPLALLVSDSLGTLPWNKILGPKNTFLETNASF